MSIKGLKLLLLGLVIITATEGLSDNSQIKYLRHLLSKLI
jgi:hypothetical protein